MAYQYSIDASRRLTCLSLSDDVDYDHIIECIHAVWGTPNYDPTYDAILDVRGASIRLSPVELFRIIRLINTDERALQGCVAFVSSDPVTTALSMLYQHRSRKERAVRLFASLESAEQWIAQGAT